MPKKAKKAKKSGSTKPLDPQKLLQRNLANLQAKVERGATLTAAEVALLRQETGEAQSGPGNFAKNQSRLADILEVSRKTVQRYAKMEGAPKPRPNGDLNISEWRAFLALHEALDVESEDAASLKAQQILLQNRILQQKIDRNDGILVEAEQVEKDTAALIATAKAVLLSGPSSLAPQVVGVSIPEAETLLREWLHEALSKLQSNPLGRMPEAPAQEETNDA